MNIRLVGVRLAAERRSLAPVEPIEPTVTR